MMNRIRQQDGLKGMIFERKLGGLSQEKKSVFIISLGKLHPGKTVIQPHESTLFHSRILPDAAADIEDIFVFQRLDDLCQPADLKSIKTMTVDFRNIRIFQNP